MTPPAAVPPPPEAVANEPAAADEWARITALLLTEGAVAELDRAVLALYCTAYARWLKATAKLVETGGEIVANDRGEVIQNPWLAVVRAAAREVTAAAEPLGLSPAARTKVKRPGAASPAVAALDNWLADEA